jgi:hypothetical protein
MEVEGELRGGVLYLPRVQASQEEMRMAEGIAEKLKRRVARGNLWKCRCIQAW